MPLNFPALESQTTILISTNDGRWISGAAITSISLIEDMAMRTAFDFSPLFRSTVGFDRIFDLLDNAQRVSTIDNWPPYDIVKTGEDQYRVTLAVAGFGES